jgi:hypothetical protein
MDKTAVYYRYYRSQSGGEIPVFRGGRQSGEGLGDILRGIFRFIAPIALRGFSTFAGHTLDAHQKGASLKDAAKSALNPTLNSVTTGIAEQFRGRQQQTGSGVRSNLRNHRRVLHHPYKALGASTTNKLDVYKKGGRKRRRDGRFATEVSNEKTHYNF